MTSQCNAFLRYRKVDAVMRVVPPGGGGWKGLFTKSESWPIVMPCNGEQGSIKAFWSMGKGAGVVGSVGLGCSAGWVLDLFVVPQNLFWEGWLREPATAMQYSHWVGQEMQCKKSTV